MARRRALDRIRRRQAYTAACDRFALTQESDPVRRCVSSFLEGDDSPDQKSDKERLLELIYVYLPEEQAACVIHHWLYDLSQRQVAKALKVPLGTVKTRIELGFAKLCSVVARDPYFKKGRESVLPRA